MDDREVGSAKRGVNQIVSIRAILACMTGIVQLDNELWLHCLRLAQNEVNVLTVDPVGVGHVAPSLHNIEQV